MGQWNLAEMSLGLTEGAHYEVAVLPVGATEAHGRHLPYATDTLQVDEIARRACQEADARGAQVLLLPTVAYGINENTLGFPWTMSLRPSTLFRVVTDLVSCVEHHGIPKLVLLNGHGGNEFQPHLRELCRETAVHILLVNWYQAAREAHAAIFQAAGEHADEMETSLLLALHPELVHLELAGDGSTREPVLTALREGWAWLARPWDRVTRDSSYGDPRGATADKGARYLEAVVGRLAGLLVEVSASPADELYPYH
jgi:creatinine amidohydrolase